MILAIPLAGSFCNGVTGERHCGHWPPGLRLIFDRQGEAVLEFFVNPKSCHDINTETEPTRCICCCDWRLAANSHCRGAAWRLSQEFSRA
jgi:hypothetical protein